MLEKYNDEIYPLNIQPLGGYTYITDWKERISQTRHDIFYYITKKYIHTYLILFNIHIVKIHEIVAKGARTDRSCYSLQINMKIDKLRALKLTFNAKTHGLS